MQIEIKYGPSYALAIVNLEKDEEVISESGAMVSMDSHVKIETSAGKKDQGALGGLMSGLKRMVAGESFFQNRFRAEGKSGEVTFAPTFVGDMDKHELNDSTLLIQSKSFVCSGVGVDLNSKWGGGKTFFGGEGFILLKASGSGPIVFNAFGGIRKIEIDGSFTVDTGHIVAFEETLTFKVERFGGGWKSFIFGGEGLVCHFTGKGTLWIQTRNPQEFGQFLGSKLPMRNR